MITVSRISRHQSQRKKVISQPGTKRKQSTSRVIHVLIGLPSTIPPTKNNRHPVMDKVLTKNRIFSVHRRDQQLLSQVRLCFSMRIDLFHMILLIIDKFTNGEYFEVNR